MQLSLFSDPAIPLIQERLMARHGRIDDARYAHPIDQLILSLISSKTRDQASGVAFEKLRTHFSRWDAVIDAEPGTIASLIGDVENASLKAEQLIAALKLILAKHGTLDLSFLANWPVTDAWFWLQRLPGVGPKVAAATLNFSNLRKPILAVDRHLLRVGQRLGLLPPKADFRRGHRLFNGRMPNDWGDHDYYQLHWLIKSHSQAICRAGKPRCDECPLTDICRYYSKTYPTVDKS